MSSNFQKHLVYRNALEAIENTPLVHLEKVNPTKANLFAKMEFLQPGGSVKDRAAKRIILTAREKGLLKPGQSVVEMTSGNMGAGLAIVCGILGHPFIATMSEGNSPQRASMLRGLGAEVVLVPQVNGSPGKVTGDDIKAAALMAEKIAHEQEAFYVNQFHAEDGFLAHEQGTAQEIIQALYGNIDAFVAGVGSGGTLVGTARGLKAFSNSIKCFAVEPYDSEVLSGKPVQKKAHILQGMGYGEIVPLWEDKNVDGYISVTDEEAKEMQFQLAKSEGLFVGFSAAANVVASIKAINTNQSLSKKGANVVTVLCDTGLKYSF